MNGRLQRTETGRLWMYRGDSRTILLKVRLNGVPVDITGFTLTFTAASASPAASFTGTTTDGSVSISNGPLGEAIFPVQPAMTSGFPNRTLLLTYQWVMIDLSSATNTIEEDTIEIRRNV